MDLCFSLVAIILIFHAIFVCTDCNNTHSVADTRPILSSMQTDPSESKSELKCDDYTLNANMTCHLLSEHKVNKRSIIDGINAEVNEFPHMIALGKRNSGKFTLICGAILISHTWVLSAAHCTHGPNGVPSHIRAGVRVLTDEKAGVLVSIEQIIRHPDYKPPMMYADIALIKLHRGIRFTASIHPACLHQQYDTMPTKSTISGWGVTEFAGDQSDKLQKADLDVIDSQACIEIYNNSKEAPHGITPNMICAGDRSGGWSKDSCQGDSGGPLQVTLFRNRCFRQSKVIGITSFGLGCALNNTPGVYTKVSYYVPWIENIVWPSDPTF